ncbi:hypothetical protein MAR_028896, partial [Mya arenaria]
VYVNGSEDAGFVSAIPLVSENNLRHDNDGEAYNNGTFTVMERKLRHPNILTLMGVCQTSNLDAMIL